MKKLCIDCKHHRFNRAGGMLCAAPQLKLKAVDNPDIGFVAGVGCKSMRCINGLGHPRYESMCGREGRWYEQLPGPTFHERAIAKMDCREGLEPPNASFADCSLGRLGTGR